MSGTKAKSRLAIIPARGGSKGLPRKNILPLCGKPLIAWTIEAAIDSEIFDQVIVSTDCPEIQQVALAHGASAPFLRPTHLATDTATSVEVVLDCLERYPSHEWFCLLQPTSPLRTAQDIRDSWTCILNSPGAVSLTSISETSHPIEWTLRPQKDKTLQPIFPEQAHLRRQELPAGYLPNGSIYWVQIEAFLRDESFRPAPNIGHYLPKERAVDIDSKLDLEIAKAILKTGSHEV